MLEPSSLMGVSVLLSVFHDPVATNGVIVPTTLAVLIESPCLAQTNGRSESEISDAPPATQAISQRLRELTAELRNSKPDCVSAVARTRSNDSTARKPTARERIDLLLDKNSYSQEIGLLVAYDNQGKRGKGKGEGYGEEIGAARRRVSSLLLGACMIAKLLL